MKDLLFRIVYKDKKSGYGDIINTSLFDSNGLNAFPFDTKKYEITHIDKALSKKDIEGNIVYNNDIVEVLTTNDNRKSYIGKIVYDDNEESFKILVGKETINFGLGNQFKKLGNIYLNPQLLEV